MLGMVSAIPKTPLYDRLAAEGRLDTVGRAGVRHQRHPAAPRPRTAPRRLRASLQCAERPDAYFDRLEDLYLQARLDFSRGANRHWRRHPWRLIKAKGLFLAQALGLLARLSWNVPDPSLRREYLRRVWRLLKVRRDPSVLWIYVAKCALHYHGHTMARQMVEGRSPVVNTY